VFDFEPYPIPNSSKCQEENVPIFWRREYGVEHRNGSLLGGDLTADWAQLFPSTASFPGGWTHTGVSNPEMRIFRQGKGHQESTRLRGDVACHVAQAIQQIHAEIGEIDHLWMETS